MAEHRVRIAMAFLLTVTVLSMASAALAQTPPAEQDDLSLSRALIARTIENREPQGTEGPFEVSAGRIYVFLEVANRTGGEQVLTVVWQKEGSERTMEQEVSVGNSRRWRTWASLRLNERRIGSWQVEVRTADGQVLGSVEFVVQ
ncbi:MAG: DUF2914 domain-containing protein [Bradymonadales bacterium]|nr:DUF2914 domain-containing protein [Bradymonadales bacterium]